VEDHDLILLGLRRTVELGGFQIIGDAGDGLRAVHQIAQLTPDVVIMDIGLPGIDGIEATHRIRAGNPLVKVLMLTSRDCENEIFAALYAGANGYCLKDVSKTVLLAALESVAEGALWIDPRIAAKVLARMSAQPSLADIDEAEIDLSP